MTFKRRAFFWRFFAFSGMNCAFRAEYWPHFKFDEAHERFDDIFMGYRLQAEAYRRGHCINLAGPLVTHSRQSNVWANLLAEAPHMELNETLWQNIAVDVYAKGHTGINQDELARSAIRLDERGA